MDIPHLTDCCGQHYCQYCLSRWTKTPNGHSCPYCRDKNFNHMHDKHFDRSIKELKIRCINLTHGCNWTGPLMNLTFHLTSESDKGCKFQVVDCPLQCGEMYERRYTAAHVRCGCKLRGVSCEHCGDTFKEYLLDQHFSVCDHAPVDCPESCGHKIRRCDVEHHLSVDCAKGKVQCAFHDIGCQELVKRHELEQHVHQCKDKFMVKAYEKMMSEMHALKLEVENLRSERTLLHSKMDSLKEGLKMCYDNAELLKQRNAQLKSVVLNELEFLHAPCKPCETLSIECIQSSLQNHMVYLTPAGNCVTFRLMDYHTHKESGQVWYSPSFYVNQGYKFCLAFHLNGVGAGKGTHVTVYLHQMMGRFDSNLTWPFFFEQDLDILLMRQELVKDNKKFMFKSSTQSTTPPHPRSTFRLSSSHSTCTSMTETMLVSTTTSVPGELRKRSKSILGRDTPSPASSPELPNKSPTKMSLPVTYVAECQVMSISKTLNRPIKSTSSVAAQLELFCLQKVFSSVVFLDSVVLKCQLKMEDGSSALPVGLDDLGWATWTHK